MLQRHLVSLFCLLVLVNSVLFPVAAASAAYNRSEAVEYAEYYWNKRNAAYNWFSADCQNFVSQCVHAGGIPMHFSSPEWYHTNEGFGYYEWTTSWINCEAFWSWGENAEHLDWLNSFNPSEQSSTCSGSLGGDVLHYDWTSDREMDHASIRVLDDSTTDPDSGYIGHVIDQHTTDRYHAIWHLRPYNSKRDTTTIHLLRPQ